jgi:hypothetical protein
MGHRKSRRLAAPDLRLLNAVVSDRILEALRMSAAQLTRLGIRHWVVGGLAVGAHGYPESTADIVFLVGDEAFEHHEDGVVTMKPGAPIRANGIAIDYVSALIEPCLAAAFRPTSAELEVAPLEILLFLKLRSPRARDWADVVELIKAGADTERARTFLSSNAAELVAKLDRAIATARAEEG